MKNLFDFADEEIKPEKHDDLKDKVENYMGKSQDELLSTLLNNVSKQKQDGSFNYNELKSSVEKILPYLSLEQSKNINSILERLK